MTRLTVTLANRRGQGTAPVKQRTIIDRSVTIRGRWMRLAVFFGSAPGTHMGFWRTQGGFTGTLQGWNYRIGNLHRCVTVLAHTRRAPTANARSSNG